MRTKRKKSFSVATCHHVIQVFMLPDDLHRIATRMEVVLKTTSPGGDLTASIWPLADGGAIEFVIDQFRARDAGLMK